MKKFYVLIVVIICSAAQGFSQTWIGGATGSWNTAANWSPATVPNSNTADVTFNTAADVTLGSATAVRSINVGGANNVRIKGTTNFEVITVAGAITVEETTGTLRLYSLTMQLSNNIQGTINGSLLLEGTSADYAEIRFPEIEGQSAAFNINGTLTDSYGASMIVPIDDYLKFNAGSKLILPGNTAKIYFATYHPSSEIIISGAPPAIGFDETETVGTFTYNSSTQTGERFLTIPSGLVFGGSLNIQNTNNGTLVLLTNTGVLNQVNYDFTVSGNFNISNTSVVALSSFSSTEDIPNVYSGTINGSFNMAGTSFSLQNTVLVPTGTSTLSVKGNINHTAGVITAVSTATSPSVGLYTIEMNGSGAQSISSFSQAFNNAGNQVQLKISNPAGITLQTPLSVGKLAFSANGKLITDETNFVMVMNPLQASVSGSGFVDGPVRRATNLTSEYIFPTGAGSTASYVSVFPAATTSSIYQASYTNAAPGNTTVNTPLTDIVDYYWEVDRIGSGANAAIELTLPGAVSGATSTDYLLVSKSSGGSNWERSFNLSTNTFLLGDATSGKLRSAVQTSFSSFTIGWAPMDAALPIDLLSFTVNKSGSKANLNWKVTGSSTPKSFEVMKSADGINFNQIGTVTGLTAKTSYDFTDNNLLAGNNYYRLKMLDIDGTVSYSNIIVVMNGTVGTLITSMIPTMVSDRARLNISSASKGNMQLVITDINGRIIQTQNASINAGNQEIWINATKLATGYFQITGYINGEKTATIRFFKR